MTGGATMVGWATTVSCGTITYDICGWGAYSTTGSTARGSSTSGIVSSTGLCGLLFFGRFVVFFFFFPCIIIPKHAPKQQRRSRAARSNAHHGKLELFPELSAASVVVMTSGAVTATGVGTGPGVGTVAAVASVGAKVGGRLGAAVCGFPGLQHTWHNEALFAQQLLAPSPTFVQFSPLMGLVCVLMQLSEKQTSFLTPLWHGRRAAGVGAGATGVGAGATGVGAGAAEGASVGACVGAAVSAAHDATSVDEAVIRG